MVDVPLVEAGAADTLLKAGVPVLGVANETEELVALGADGVLDLAAALCCALSIGPASLVLLEGVGAESSLDLFCTLTAPVPAETRVLCLLDRG